MEKNNNFQEITSKFINNILENNPPYKKISFNYHDYNSMRNVNTVKLNGFCNSCDHDSVFCGNIPNSFTCIQKILLKQIGLNGATPIEELFSDFQLPMLIETECAKCGEKHFYSIYFEKNTVTKIGQYPSFASEKTNEVRKYKNLISKYYPELTKSISAYSQGMGVASFTYLRRILEWIIDERFSGEQNTKFIDKLKSVEKEEIIIPKELEPIKNDIYSVLSKGIHEYTEDECLTLYDAVLFVITRILDIELEKKENKKKTDNIMKRIKGKLSEDKNNE